VGTGFEKGRQRAVSFEVLCNYGQQSVAEESKRTDDVGISASCSIFTPAGISSPMVPVFDATPVIADQNKPCFG
jgi:hypothetical protein